MDIFGSIQPPRWLNPDDSTKEWTRIAEGSNAFSSAFNQAKSQKHQNDRDLMEQKRADLNRVTDAQIAQKELEPVFNSLKGVDSSPAFLGVVKEHPEWMYGKYSAPVVANYGKLIANNEKIQMDATKAQALSIAGKEEIQRNADFLKRKSSLNSVELGRLEDIQSNGVLNNETRALEIDKLFADAEARKLNTKVKPTALETNAGLLKTDEEKQKAIRIGTGIEGRAKPVAEGEFSGDVKSQLSQFQKSTDNFTKGILDIQKEAAKADRELKDAEKSQIQEYRNKINQNNNSVNQLREKNKKVPQGTKSEVLPYPKSKDDAVKGKTYQTKQGPMTWDGSQFVP